VYCITRKDMKFGGYLVPARTRATVIGNPSSTTVDAPGVQLSITISFWNMHPNRKDGVPLNELQVLNELGQYDDAKLTGLMIDTNTEQVYMDAGDQFYRGATLYKWQVEKIFEGKIPEDVSLKEHNDREYKLDAIVSCLGATLASWVQKNCDFRRVTKRDIENGETIEDACPGDTMLSNKGLRQFEEKLLEYQNRLESTGFTYEFDGGLVWN